MILFTILTIILIIIAVFMVLTVSILGAGGIIIFADVIVCAVIIGLIIKWLIGRK